MSAIQIFTWFLLYTLQLWNLSLVVLLPGLLSALLRSKEGWKQNLANALFPQLIRFQLVLFSIVMMIYFGGEYFPVFGQFHDAYLAIYNLNHTFGFMAILWQCAALGMVLDCRRKLRTKPENVPNFLFTNVLLNGWFLVFFAMVSSTLFTGNPLRLSYFDVVARLIHILFSATALVGATVAFAAREIAKKDTEHGEKVAKLGLKWMLIGGSVQVFAGFVMLMAIGMKAFPVPVGHILLTFGILCAIGVVVMSAMSFGKTGSLLKIARATAMTVMLTFFLMVGLRIADLTKRYAAEPQPEEQSIQP